MDKKEAGIYRIYNLKNRKSYMGGTTNLERRKIQHFSDLKNNKNSSPILQEEYNLLGKDFFQFQILEKIDSFDKEVIEAIEQTWLDTFHPEYNTNIKAGRSIESYIRTPEAIKKANQSRKDGLSTRKPRKPTVWKAGHPPNTGKKFSDEFKEKIRQANLGEKNPNYGKPRTEETKEKMRVSHKKELWSGIVSPEGEVFPPISNVMDFCRERGWKNYGSVYALLRGEIPAYKGWKRVN